MEAASFDPLKYGLSAGSDGEANAAAMQSAVAAAISAGGGTIEIPNGRYEISGTIVLNSRGSSSPVRIVGKGDVTLVETGGAEKQLFAVGDEDECGPAAEVVLENLRIEGAFQSDAAHESAGIPRRDAR